MKKILLFTIISIVTLSAPNLSNNQNNDKSVAELQIQIKELEEKINKQNKEYLKLKKEVEERIGLTYNIDQIYSTSKSHYEESIKKVEELYSKSFENYNSLIIAFLTGLGIIVTLCVGLFIFVKIDDSKKIKEFREELLRDMKDKKEEIEKSVDRILANSIAYTNEIVNVKTSELDTLKLQVKEMDGILAKELTKLEKKTVEELEKIRNEVDFKLKNINELSGEIKNTLNAEKENIIDEIKAKILITSDWGGGKTENMFSSYDKSKKIDEEESKEMKLDHYKNLVNSQKYDEAVLGYENIIKNSKDKDELYEAYKDLGNIYQKLDRYEESVINYKKALQFMKNKNIESKIDLYKEISYILKRMSRYNESLTYLEMAYELNPNLFKKCELEVLFELYNRSNNKEKSLEILNKIKNNETKESEIYRIDKKIASLYCHHKEYKTALILYKKLLEKAKKNYKNDLPLLYFYLGLIYFNLKDYKNSRENFEEIDNNNDLYKTGQIYIKIIEEKAD